MSRRHVSILIAGLLTVSALITALGMMVQRRSLIERTQQLSGSKGTREDEVTQLVRSCSDREAELRQAMAAHAAAQVQLNQLGSEIGSREAELKALAEAQLQNEPAVKASMDVKLRLQDIVMDLLILSKTDADAKGIIEKYNIQQNLPGSQ